MTPIVWDYGLPFVRATLKANGQSLTLERVLIDTGSAGTLIDADDLRRLNVIISPDDPIRFVTGIGGSEPYVEKQIDGIEIDGQIIGPITVEAGAIRYAIKIDAIIGSDVLRQAKANIDFERMEITIPIQGTGLWHGRTSEALIPTVGC